MRLDHALRRAAVQVVRGTWYAVGNTRTELPVVRGPKGFLEDVHVRFYGVRGKTQAGSEAWSAGTELWNTKRQQGRPLCTPGLE